MGIHMSSSYHSFPLRLDRHQAQLNIRTSCPGTLSGTQGAHKKDRSRR